VREAFALEQLFFLRLHLLAFGDVGDRRQDEDSFGGVERTQADLDGNLGAILTHGVEVSPRTHRARVGVL
jgi:hypothetical protein